LCLGRVYVVHVQYIYIYICGRFYLALLTKCLLGGAWDLAVSISVYSPGEGEARIKNSLCSHSLWKYSMPVFSSTLFLLMFPLHPLSHFDEACGAPCNLLDIDINETHITGRRRGLLHLGHCNGCHRFCAGGCLPQDSESQHLKIQLGRIYSRMAY
jgi:hypothetical protein